MNLFGTQIIIMNTDDTDQMQSGIDTDFFHSKFKIQHSSLIILSMFYPFTH